MPALQRLTGMFGSAIRELTISRVLAPRICSLK
jgi:hypothetical protein